MTVGTLSAIHIYPVKSCRGVALAEVTVVATGLADDRLYQVVDADGAPLTQRQHPVLATVQPLLIPGGVRVEADGIGPLDVARPTRNDVTASSLLGVPVEAADAGDAAATWFSNLLGVPARLVAMTESTDYRLPIPGIDMELSWADAAAVLVANRSSLDWLVAHATEPFEMDRFRPNLVVDVDSPWVEDTWRDFSVGSAQFGLGLAWPRCTIPQIDQRAGTRHKEPAKVLKEHRWCTEAPDADVALRALFEASALFGIGCTVEPVGATLTVGDDVVVRETSDPVIAAPS